MLSTITALALNWAEILLWANTAMMWSGYIAIGATIIAHAIGNKKIAAWIKPFANGLIRLVSVLPTWGLNPNTKKALDSLKELEAKIEEQEKAEEEKPEAS